MPPAVSKYCVSLAYTLVGSPLSAATSAKYWLMSDT